MPLVIGRTLPDATFMVMRDGKGTQVSVAEIFGGKNVVLFAVPGAFTPTCHLKHLPGFLSNFDAFLARGVDTVACTAVNDHHVMAAWGKASGIGEKIVLLADGTAAFAKAMGLDYEAGSMGVRSRRYAAHVVDRELRILQIEDSPGVEASSAEALLKTMAGGS
jgi:glutaredoxin/glutathione-dependent peroxiredoxin